MDAAWRIISSSLMQSATDHDALAYRARAEAALLNAGSTDLTTADLEDTLDQLWASRYLSGTGQPGFGLDYAWDAFSDGSTNPVDTIYAYTTATAALAYLDGHVVLGGTTQLDRAKELVDTLLTDCWSWVSGAWLCVWYSDQAADQTGTKAVNNANALLLAALARIDRYDGVPYAATERTGIETFTSAGHGYGGVSGRWRYHMGTTAVNDLTHHAFMVIGTAEAGMSEMTTALSYMWTFFFESIGNINEARNEVMGTVGWGPGDGLAALCFDPSWEPQARVVALDIANDVNMAGDPPSYVDVGNARATGRFCYGLAVYAASIEGDGSLFP